MLRTLKENVTRKSPLDFARLNFTELVMKVTIDKWFEPKFIKTQKLTNILDVNRLKMDF